MRGLLLALVFAIGVPADALAKDATVVKLRGKPKQQKAVAKKKQPPRAAKRKPVRRPAKKIAAKPKAKPKREARERPRPMP